MTARKPVSLIDLSGGVGRKRLNQGDWTEPGDRPRQEGAGQVGGWRVKKVPKKQEFFAQKGRKC